MILNKSKHVGGGLVLFVLAAFMIPAASAVGGSLYKAKETTYDLFGSYIAAQESFSEAFNEYPKNGAYGGGFGVTRFTSERFGIGSDIVMSANRGAFVDSTTANAYFRLPLGESGLAPYVFGGGGSAYDPTSQWIWQFGFGLEFRTKSKWGIFVDGRYVWGQEAGTDTSLLRAGLRLVY
jgi:hypothetical protein